MGRSTCPLVGRGGDAKSAKDSTAIFCGNFCSVASVAQARTGGDKVGYPLACRFYLLDGNAEAIPRLHSYPISTLYPHGIATQSSSFRIQFVCFHVIPSCTLVSSGRRFEAASLDRDAWATWARKEFRWSRRRTKAGRGGRAGTAREV